GIPVVQREPAALHLSHDAVAFLERVRLLVQIYRERLDRVRRDRLRTLPALAVPPAHDVSRHHQLVTLHLRPARYGIGIDVDELYDTVGIAARRRGVEVRDDGPRCGPAGGERRG